MKTVTLANQKGGVAKTTTSLALASGLTQKGFKVLAVDLDPQSNFCLSAGIDILNMEISIFNVFKGSVKASDAIVKSPMGYDVLPGGLDLAGADMEFTQTGREFMLKEALRTVEHEYDYCIIDVSPTLGILTVNALVAADSEIVPMAADAYSLQGLAQLIGMIDRVKRYCNPGLKISGLLVTKFHKGENSAKAAEDMIQSAADRLQTQVFKTRIRESVAVRDAALQQSDFMLEAPKSNASVDYKDFIEEFIEVENNGK